MADVFFKINVILIIPFLIVLFWRILIASRNRAIYINAPLFTIHLSNFNINYLPYFTHYVLGLHPLDSRISIVISSGIMIDLLFMISIGGWNTKRIVMVQNPYQTNIKTLYAVMIFPLLMLIFLYGIKSGILIKLMTGQNVETYRRTAEIGLGFIKDIPTVLIPFILTIYLLGVKSHKIVPISILLIFVGTFMYLCTANKSDMALILALLLLFFQYRYRGFRLLEYLLLIVAQPVLAGFLQMLRGGANGVADFLEKIMMFFRFSSILFEFNTVGIVNVIHDKGFLWGQQYLSSLTKIIPRFLWKNKPLSFDYKFKEMTGMTWEGGGASLSWFWSLYVNWGLYFHILFYFLLTLLCYKVFLGITEAKSFEKQIMLILLSLYFLPDPLLAIQNIQLLAIGICYIMAAKFILRKNFKIKVFT